MNFLNFGGTTARGDGRGAISTFRDGSVIADRPAPPPFTPPTLPSPPPRLPRPSLDQSVAEIFTQVWARCRRVLARRGLPNRKLLGTAGATALLLAGAHWAYPWAAFASHRAAAQSDENRGDEQDALGEYTQMIALQPRNPEGYIHRALAYYTAFQYGQAIADETQVQRLTTNPQERAKSLMWRGYDHDLSGDHARGIADFTASLAVSPTIPDTYAQTADASDKTPDARRPTPTRAGSGLTGAASNMRWRRGTATP